MSDRYNLGCNDTIDDIRRVLLERKVNAEGQHSRDAAATGMAIAIESFMDFLTRTGSLTIIPHQKEMLEHLKAIQDSIAEFRRLS